MDSVVFYDIMFEVFITYLFSKCPYALLAIHMWGREDFINVLNKICSFLIEQFSDKSFEKWPINKQKYLDETHFFFSFLWKNFLTLISIICEMGN